MNGSAEKIGGDIMRRGFAILHDSGLKKPLWDLCMETASYLRNRSPNASLDGKTPYETLYNVKPDVGHLRIIGSLVYTHVPKEKRLKHESHTNLNIFVSYTDTERLVKVYDPHKRTVKSYRDVVIDETLRWLTRATTHDEPGEYELVIPSPKEYLTSPIVPFEGEKAVTPTVPLEGKVTLTITTSQDPDSEEEDVFENPHEFEPTPPPPPPQSRTRSQRLTANKPPVRYEDELADREAKERAAKLLKKRGIDPRSTARAAFSRTYAVRTRNLYATSINAYGVKIDPNSRIPRSYKAAIHGPDGPEWIESTKEEFYSLKDNKTWRIVRRLTGIYVLTGKWVFKIKEDDKGDIVRFKSR